MINKKYIPLLATCFVFVLLYLSGSFRFENFNSIRVVNNFFIDNAFLAITAIGMTFVILSGGIDLSVGSVIACVGIASAVLIEQVQLHPLIVITMMLIAGCAFGASMGFLIHTFELPPFIVTLAGMFFLRGLSFVISLESVPINHEFYDTIADFGIYFPGGVITSSMIILFLVLTISIILAHYTKFGRNMYAIGGSESSAMLLGIPIGRTKIAIYAFNGLLAALAGVVYTFYTFSGYSLAGLGLELDAIAAVVIGGTLLTGGVGFVFGTLIGVLIQGVIQTFVTFDGTLNSWWTKITVGILLFLFIVLQRFLSSSYVTAHQK